MDESSDIICCYAIRSIYLSIYLFYLSIYQLISYSINTIDLINKSILITLQFYFKKKKKKKYFVQGERKDNRFSLFLYLF